MKLLNSIPHACIRGENGDSLTPLLKSIHNIQNSYNVNIRRDQIGKSFDNRDAHWKKMLGTPDDPWYGAENVDVEDYAHSILDAFVKSVLCPPTNVGLLGFKDIHFYKAGGQFVFLMNCMLKYFPKSRIIFLTRNLNEVSKSGWWKNLESNTVVSELEEANRLFHSFHNHNKENTIVFDYHEFSNRATGVKRIFDFVGANFDRAKIDSVLDVRLNHLK